MRRTRTIILFLIAVVLVGVIVFSGNDQSTPPQNSNSGGPTTDQPKTDPVKAAALYAGTIAGMALICGFDSEPVMHSYKAFLQHHSAVLLATDQEELLNLNAQGLAMGMKMQKANGAMPCSQLHGEMLKAIDKLRDA